MATANSTEADRPPAEPRRAKATVSGNWGWFLFRGILALALGIIALLFPLSAVFAFTMVFAVFAFVDGLFSLISGIRGARHKEERWGSLIFRGIVGILVGALFLIWPAVSTFSYALVTVGLVAAWSIITGVTEIAAAIRLRKEITGEFWLGLAGLLSLLLGVALVLLVMTNPLATLLSAAWLIGFWALVAGGALIALALRLRRQRGSTSEASSPRA
jgi:uncharacterized membrane protein HdeD (DUF308 family)